jgi:hypothetical protein
MIHFQAPREAKDTVLFQWKSRIGIPKGKARSYVRYLKSSFEYCQIISWFQMACGLTIKSVKIGNVIVAISFFFPT